MRLEPRCLGRIGVVAFFADVHQRIIGNHAGANAGLSLALKLFDAGNGCGQGPGTDQPHHIGNVDGVVGFARFLIRKTESSERCRSRLGFPHAFDGRQFHFLAVGGAVAGFVAQQHHGESRCQSECCCHRDRAARQLDMASAQQVPGRNAEHEDRRGHVSG